MKKLKTIIGEVKDQAATLKDTLESERVKRMNEKINCLRKELDILQKENHQLKALLTRVINDLDKENKRNRDLLKSLDCI